VTAPAERSEEAKLAAWIEREVGGRVTRVDRLPRWRPAWDVDVDLGDRVLALHARGERERHMAMPFWIADERRTHDLLESHGIPVPHAYGYCDDPYALVMDRLPGHVDLSFAASDDERAHLNLEYLGLLPRIYAIPLDAARAAGWAVPTTPEELALGLFGRYEVAYDERMPAPEPTSELLRVWLHRHHPRHRGPERARFITYDAFQFMFDGGRLTGLLDFELAHVGDPLTELAALRIRETIKNLGDLPAIAQSWSAVTGEALDHDVVEFHSIAYNAQTVLSAAPLLARPSAEGDHMSYWGWYVNSARWALEDIAALTGVELSPVGRPEPRPGRHRPTYDHLVDALSNRGPQLSVGDHEQAKLFRVARHLRRVDEIGTAVDEADRDDAAEVLGTRPETADLDAALCAFIRGSGPEQEAALVRLLDRRVQRQHLLLGPEGSNLLRHPRLRSIRAGAATDRSAPDDQAWTPGLIAGTR
jgi:aminoglycoside phosphotransferase (APT) family kinase protein